ncbi:hypothetical protein BDF22DRAFT_494312 [Syncephalis plumigaleata]|nr:hypothetical protein BDF22DRAFT_494312 [Syncephalis plumigaleata]
MDPTLRQLMRYRKPQNVRQLFLDNQRIPSIELLCYEPCSSSSDTTDAYSPLPRFSGLLSLSLTGVHCTSLKNFPSLPELRRLALADNRIVDGLEALVDKVPLLNYLDLSNNRISDFLTLTPLRYMTKLRHLCLLDCEITKLPNYRAKIFEMLPTLQSLDGQDWKWTLRKMMKRKMKILNQNHMKEILGKIRTKTEKKTKKKGKIHALV